MPMWGSMWFQNSVSDVMEHLLFFHDHMMMILLMVVVLVGYFLILSVFKSFYSIGVSGGQGLESIWTIVPIFVLFMIALPSLRLLYLMEELDGRDLNISVTGFQWYWGYEYMGFEDKGFDSYMENGSSEEDGVKVFRLLDVDNSLVMPFCSKVGMLITSGDVIHSWTVPSLGVKVDAVPGRLNQILLMMKRPGLFYGQCSEICGANHSFMPIVIKSLSYFDFFKNILML